MGGVGGELGGSSGSGGDGEGGGGDGGSEGSGGEPGTGGEGGGGSEGGTTSTSYDSMRGGVAIEWMEKPTRPSAVSSSLSALKSAPVDEKMGVMPGVISLPVSAAAVCDLGFSAATSAQLVKSQVARASDEGDAQADGDAKRRRQAAMGRAAGA